MTDSIEEPTDYPPPRMPRPPGRPYTIAGFVVATVAVALGAVLFGLIAIVLGFVGRRKGDALGRWAMIAGLVATAAATLLLILFAGSDDEALAFIR